MWFHLTKEMKAKVKTNRLTKYLFLGSYSGDTGARKSAQCHLSSQLKASLSHKADGWQLSIDMMGRIAKIRRPAQWSPVQITHLRALNYKNGCKHKPQYFTWLAKQKSLNVWLNFCIQFLVVSPSILSPVWRTNTNLNGFLLILFYTNWLLFYFYTKIVLELKWVICYEFNMFRITYENCNY